VSLPGSPRGWLDGYEGATIDDPEVCSRLFSPALTAAYGRSIHSTCTGYFTRLSSSSVTVRRILRDHRPGGWQAVDVLDGRLR